MKTQTIRRVWIAGVALLLAATLSGCILGTGLYVRNNYPFPISIHLPYIAYDGRPVNVDGGTIPPGQQQRMNVSLLTLLPGESQDLVVTGESQDLVVIGPTGKVVQQVRLSSQQENDAYHAHRPAAVFVSVGANRVTIDNGTDVVIQKAQIKQEKKIAIFAGGLVSALIIAVLVVWRLRARPNALPSR